MAPLLHLLILGRTDRAEAQPLSDWMTAALQPAEVRRYATLDEAYERGLADCWIPDLVVVIQSRPDESNRRLFDLYTQVAPLARWVVCCGAWCEAEGRTRDNWPPALRVPLSSAAARIEHEWRLLSGEDVACIPLSASRDEVFPIDHPAIESPRAARPVAVSSPDPEYRRYLCELLISTGHALDEGNPESVWVVDLDPWDQRRQMVEQVCRQAAGGVVGLMSLPCPRVSMELAVLGVIDVVPKLGNQQRIVEAIARSARTDHGDR